ncbi:MAG: DUF6262 family protein [Lachnospiraceae bacterium]|nr:DUF6262 family protein [Lachnospiraceae bacterium]
MSKSNQEVREAIYTEKRKKTEQKVDDAIRTLAMSGQEINFNSVSKASGVSKTTLYNSIEIKERILSLRTGNNAKKDLYNQKIACNDKNKDMIIESLKRRIIKLESENKELKAQLQVAYENYYNKL